MREVIATGKTVDAAIENGCKELGLQRDAVSVEILEIPVNKLFKRIPAKVKITAASEIEEVKVQPEPVAAKPQVAQAGMGQKANTNDVKPSEAAQRPAKKSLLPNEPEVPIDLAENTQARKAADYLSSILLATGAQNVRISAARQGEATILRVEEGDIAQKMDINGEVVQALSYMVDRSVNAGIDKRDAEYLRVRLDIAGYRNRRESELIALAQRVGKEVAATGRSRTLNPMNPYERLIVHTAIGEIEGVRSESIGSDVERRVVIKSTQANADDGQKSRYNKGTHGGNRRPYGQKPHGGGHGGGYQGNKRGTGGGGMRSNTPQREYATQPRDTSAAPVVPQRREAIKDGENLPLYGKIDL